MEALRCLAEPACLHKSAAAALHFQSQAQQLGPYCSAVWGPCKLMGTSQVCLFGRRLAFEGAQLEAWPQLT